MTTDGGICAQPHSIEQGRKDFKIYMSQLLETSANLDVFRNSTQLRPRDAVASASNDNPQWGTALALSTEESCITTPVELRASSQRTVGAAVDATLSPSYFLDKRRWPRAGTAPPVRSRAPPNFSWQRRPPTPPLPSQLQRPPSQSRLTHSRGEATEVEAGARMGEPLFTGSEQEGASWRPSSSSTSATLTAVERLRDSDRRGAGHVDRDQATCDLQHDNDGGGEGDAGAGEGESAGGWKAAWARRLVRGPLCTEYRDRFPWPPAAESHAEAAVENIPQRTPRPQGRSFFTPGGDGGVGGRRNGDCIGAEREDKGRGYVDDVDLAAATAGPSSFPSTRQQAGFVPKGRGGSQLHPNSETSSPAPMPTGTRTTRNVLRRSGDALCDPSLPEHEPECPRCTATSGAGYEIVREAWRDDEPGGEKRDQQQRQQEQHQRWQRRRQRQHEPLGRREEGVQTLGKVEVQEERKSRAALESKAVEASQRNDYHRCGSSAGEQGDSVGFEEWGRDGRCGTGAARLGGGTSCGRREETEGYGRRSEGLRKEGLEERERGIAVDFASQSIPTEYMTKAPEPGRRGKRTGMGMDDVGRLLAGRRAEQSRRVPDLGFVARLGMAADRAISSASPGHLMEMCRVRSPSPTARRLLLALVVALGLRWRRWSDVRMNLLGNKSELKGFLLRFDKDRPGLTSGDLRPFVEDPDLSPAQVKQVAVCMVWLSRWLRSLYDYLLAREGKITATPEIFPPASTRRRAKRHSHREAHKKGQPLSPRPRAHRAGVARSRSRDDVDRGGRRGFSPSKNAAEAEKTREAAALASADLAPGGATTRPLSSNALPRQKQQNETAVVPGERHEHQDHEHNRGGAESSQALATRVAGSSSIPKSLAMVTGGVGGVNRGDGVREAVGAGERRAGSRVLVGDRKGGEGAPTMEASLVGGDSNAESEWTAGTVTSRGDVLEAATDDQVDIGSWVREEGSEGFSARTRGRRVERRGSAVRGSGFSQPTTTLAAGGDRAKGGGERARSHQKRSGVISNKGNWSMTSCSDGCLVAHVHKGRTPTHFANPKARRPLVGRHNPILANRRWPPPVEVKPRELTEQRSAFSLEHSFLHSSGR